MMLRLRQSAVTFSSPGICMAVISYKWHSAQKRISAVRFISFLLLVPLCSAIYLTTDLLFDSIFIQPPLIWSWKASKALVLLLIPADLMEDAFPGLSRFLAPMFLPSGHPDLCCSHLL
ncbi:hypothetical protein FKM82_020404 [Ascaphus truei]